MLPRSYLYVPADRPDRLAGASGRGADAVIADLEDGVAPHARHASVSNVTAWLEDVDPTLRTERWVRVDLEDVDALDQIVRPSLTGLVVPKAESPSHLASLGRQLARLEAQSARPGPPVALAPLVESARGLVACPGMAATDRVRHLGVGEADLTADLGIEPTPERMAPLRLQVVVASAAAGLLPPTGPTSTDWNDLEALAASTRELRGLGFGARTTIHPAQVPVVNLVFTPTTAEIDAARGVVRALEETEGGVTIGPDGRLVDEAVARAARRVLARVPRTDDVR